MLYLKKYFTEGLIQMAILLSLCGVRVDVGLETYLPPSWQEMILGPTSALTQTQFHNLRNRLEDGQDLHPKSVDLDGFFTARRLLGFVHSLDRLQIPNAELETWLVQREPDPLPVGRPDQPMNRPAPPVEPRPGISTLQDEEEEEDGLHHILYPRGEEEEGEEDWTRLYRRTEEEAARRNNRELTQNEVDQTSASLQECLRLLEETFPFTEEQFVRGGHQENQASGRQPLCPSIIPTGNPSVDLELHWQDLLAIMEPETTTDVDMAAFDHNQNQRQTRSPRGVGSGARRINSNYRVDPQTSLQHGYPTQSDSLTPSAELDDQGSAMDTRGTWENSNRNPLLSPPHHNDLLAEDFSLGLNTEHNLLTQDLLDVEGRSQYPTFPENLQSVDRAERAGSNMTPDLRTPQSSNFLFDEGVNIEGEDGLLSPLGDLLEDASMLEEIRMLDLALGEGFSPEMAARLEEEGYLDSEMVKQEMRTTGDNSNSNTEVTDQPETNQQDNPDEADSDSGLSLDFSHSPASPCASEASSYSSSSSSSSCVSAVGSPLSQDEDGDTEEETVVSEMDVEVIVKQEVLDEEEMGAVGGSYPPDVKPFSLNYGDHKVFSGFPWMEHVGHDHTYNQPWSTPSTGSVGKMPIKHPKSFPKRDNSKPYHSSSPRHVPDSKIRSRDERRARALKVPFSNDLIVNLPVEEFNDLLAKYKLSEEQLALVRDIRRRGKNKIAAQNCRKRKLDVLLELKDDVSGLRRYRSRLVREKQEALRSLQEMKRQLGALYQQVFSRLRDEEGRPLDAMEYLLQFEPDGGVTVASRQQGAAHPLTKASKKQRDKKK
ncbi:endoplasmic reticulum membrane sensor NFE2L1a [Halichoeres trimaculatus]|uniref:endoplasmic reticulum membrane sensor NFE2L1a n=1 Tax=Halichoeres trimaculatus TaxID=147232 RepID=UPI003D9F157E